MFIFVAYVLQFIFHISHLVRVCKLRSFPESNLLQMKLFAVFILVAENRRQLTIFLPKSKSLGVD